METHTRTKSTSKVAPKRKLKRAPAKSVDWNLVELKWQNLVNSQGWTGFYLVHQETFWSVRVSGLHFGWINGGGCTWTRFKEWSVTFGPWSLLCARPNLSTPDHESREGYISGSVGFIQSLVKTAMNLLLCGPFQVLWQSWLTSKGGFSLQVRLRTIATTPQQRVAFLFTR